MLAAREIERATEEEVDAVIFEDLGDLDDRLRGLAREKRLPGRGDQADRPGLG